MTPDLPDLISVEVDGARFTRVEISALDDQLRDVGGLAEAFDRAYARALLEDTPPAPAVAVASGVRPAGPVIMGRPPKPTPHAEPRWDLINQASRLGPDAPLTAVGRSGNDCLHVRLDLASSRGRLVDVDAGWLRQATTSTLTSAIQQAFADAYEKRDDS